MGSSCSSSATSTIAVNTIAALPDHRSPEQSQVQRILPEDDLEPLAVLSRPRIEPGIGPVAAAGQRMLLRSRSQSSRSFGDTAPMIAAPVIISLDGDNHEIDAPFDEHGRMRPFDFERFALVHIPSAVDLPCSGMSSSQPLSQLTSSISEAVDV